MASVDFHTLTTTEALADITPAAGESIEMVELFLVEDGSDLYIGEMYQSGQSGGVYTYRYDFEWEATSGETYKVVTQCVMWTMASGENTVP